MVLAKISSLFVLLFLSASLSSAAVSNTVVLEGVVQKYDKDYVWMGPFGKKKQTLKVPRTAVGDLDGYIIGRAKIRANVAITDIAKLNPEFGKSKK
ncbi:MAG: hypothetical protein J7501_00360 [Bdellovibrio sp.]|nr:hypothetical protein [Bdellovibrio sp.]